LGLVAGTGAGVAHYLLASGVLFPAQLHYSSGTAADFYGAIASWSTCIVVTIVVSLLTKPRPEAELRGLVYSLTPREKSEAAWYARPVTAAIVVLLIVVALNIRFF